MNELDLSGKWKAMPAGSGTDGFQLFDLEDSTWHSVTIPSHWSSQPELTGSHQSVFYRKRFENPKQGAPRTWLHFGGVFTHASVWLDGSYVSEIDGYFAPHSFEITDALAARTEHIVAVEVNAPLFGVPWASPGGIWQPVQILRSGNVRMKRMKVLCTDASTERAQLNCSVELDAAQPTDVRLQTFVTPSQPSAHGGTDHEMTRKLAAGANRLQWQITVEQPDLWWPWSLGKQPFFDVSVTITDTRSPHQISDSASMRTGLRQVAHENGFTFVNGERTFVQSIESGNDGTLPLETTRDYFHELIAKRKESGANTLVRSQWIEPQSFYDVADELGMLIFQGVPASYDGAPQSRHARQMVEVIGQHPSIAIWLRAIKRLRDRRPAPDQIKRTLDKSDPSRANIEHPTGWDLRHLSERDVLAIVPKWTKHSHFLYFTSDAREAGHHIEALRVLKYKPLGGYIAPLALPELLDGACDPIRLVAVPREPLVAGESAEIEVFLVNDTRDKIADGIVWAETLGDSWSWGGSIGPDSSAFIGVAKLKAPETGEIELKLRLEGVDSATRTTVLSAANEARLNPSE